MLHLEMAVVDLYRSVLGDGVRWWDDRVGRNGLERSLYNSLHQAHVKPLESNRGERQATKDGRSIEQGNHSYLGHLIR